MQNERNKQWKTKRKQERKKLELRKEKARNNEGDMHTFISHVTSQWEGGDNMPRKEGTSRRGKGITRSKVKGGRERTCRKDRSKEERQNPDIINGSRKKRIANGCGLTVPEVNKLLKQFKDMKVMMKQFTNMSKKGKGKKGMFGLPF